MRPNIVKETKNYKGIKTYFKQKLILVKVRIDELVMRKMFEWDSTAKILSPKERAYLADFAWGLKKLNSFHEKKCEETFRNTFKKWI